MYYVVIDSFDLRIPKKTMVKAVFERQNRSQSINNAENTMGIMIKLHPSVGTFSFRLGGWSETFHRKIYSRPRTYRCSFKCGRFDHIRLMSRSFRTTMNACYNQTIEFPVMKIHIILIQKHAIWIDGIKVASGRDISGNSNKTSVILSKNTFSIAFPNINDSREFNNEVESVQVAAFTNQINQSMC